MLLASYGLILNPAWFSTTEFIAISGDSNRLIWMTEQIRVGNDWEVWSQAVGSQTCEDYARLSG